MMVSFYCTQLKSAEHSRNRPNWSSHIKLLKKSIHCIETGYSRSVPKGPFFFEYSGGPYSRRSERSIFLKIQRRPIQRSFRKVFLFFFGCIYSVSKYSGNTAVPKGPLCRALRHNDSTTIPTLYLVYTASIL